MTYNIRFKNIIRLLIGKRLWLSANKNYKSKRFGSDYGGWDIVPDCLNHDSVVYSFGIGKDISFDSSLIDEYGLAVHGFDPTPRSVEWLSSQDIPGNFFFHKYGIYIFDGYVSFSAPKNPQHVSYRVITVEKGSSGSEKFQVKKLSTIMKNLGHENLEILKMDIEGSEYEVIQDLVGCGIRPNQILVEFHHQFDNRNLKDTKNAINSIIGMGYKIFFISEHQTDFGFIKDK